MKTRIALSLLIALTTVYAQRTSAQQTKPNDELPKVEVGLEFTTIVSGNGDAHPGAGARLTYNLNRHFAIEGAAYFSGNCQYCGDGLNGFITQGMAGIKAGQRFKKVGLFFKVRPGVMNLSQGDFDLVPTGSSKGFLVGPFDELPYRVVTRSRTDFAVDVGPVVEIYLQKKFFLRFDTGLQLQKVGSRTFHNFQFDQTTGGFQQVPVKIPGRNEGRFQFMGGLGFRF